MVNGVSNEDQDSKASTSAAANASASGSGPPTGQRSRTACVNCRATKQKCDGPSRIPCRRCELYNLECSYTDSAPRQLKRKAPEDSAGNDNGPPSSAPRLSGVQGDIAETILNRLEELTNRTKGIEEYLSYFARYGSPAPSAGGSIKVPGSADARGFTLPGMDELGLPDTTAGASHMRMGNPVSAVAESLPHMDELPLPVPLEAHGLASYTQPGLTSPDAVSRGIITVEQAQRYFQFFVDHCRYWVHGFVPEQIRDCMRIRQTSPLLFGAICCISSYYLDACNGEQGLQLYLSHVALVNETVAPIIMSPRNTELDDEFILGLAFCIIWKTPRLQSRNMNQSTFPAMQRLAKLNNATTYFLAGIAGRAARVTKLNATPTLLMGGDTSPATLARCRLWLWMCFVDAHGCMQNGRAASIDITDSLKVTRAFANLNDAPTDVELCVLLEVSSVYRTFHGSREGDQADLSALSRANAELDAITEYWYKNHPRLAYDAAFVTHFIGPFHRLVINADVYRSWAIRNKTYLDSGGDASSSSNPNAANVTAPVISHDEAKFLAIAVDAASTILLYLTTQARAEGGRRVPRFEDPQYWKDGLPIYKPMEPDVDHARHVSTAVDTVICVIIVFAAMFLAKLRAANLMRCDLSVVTPSNPIKSYEADSRGRIALYSKFFRITELASDFLEMVAPNPGHPCIAQSRVLRSLLATATNRLTQNAGDKNVTTNLSTSYGAPQNQFNLNQPPQMQTNNSSAAPMPLPRYSHSLLGLSTLDHSPNSPAAPAMQDYHNMQLQQQQIQQQPQPPQQQLLQQHNNGSFDGTNALDEVLNGIGQPGNPLVTSFLGGDEWSMLMTSLGLQSQ